jgi:glucose-1-phosphate thymidylyltransferase
MQGVILAAGKGKRLQPVTPQRTKAMAPVAGKPMVERVIDLLVQNGISDFILLVSPEDGEIIPHFQQQRPDLAIRFLVQQERLGMAHALSLAAPYLHGAFVLSACDNLTPADHIAALLAAHQSCQADATLSLMAIDIAHSASTGIVDWQDGWIRQIVEKPQPQAAPSNISSLPLYVFSPRLLDYLPAVQLSPRGEYELQDAIQLLIDRQGRVTGVCTQSRMQLTNVADLLALNRHYLSQHGEQQILTEQVDPTSQLIPPLRIEPDVTIGPGCVIGPQVYIENGCRIGAGVRLADVVVLRGAQVEEQTVYTGSIVL